MQDKIQEIIWLVDDVCHAFHADGFHHTEDSASNADALCALLKSKLRELVREPLSYEVAQKLWADTADIDCNSGGIALVRKVERAHNITNTSGVE